MFGKKKTYDFYVAGPMRGYPELNKKMFTLVAKLLRAKGFSVWSPSEHTSYLELSFAQCMTADLNSVVNECRKVVFLPGWRESLGANMEAFSAFACGKEGVEIILGGDETDFDLIAVDLSEYKLPYKDGENRAFNPHRCDINSFDQTK